jgi:sugar phosphate isomerase/epimerase
MKIDQVAAQLYTVREHCRTADDLARSLARIRAIGYRAVQLSGVGPIPEAEVRRILASEGMTACAAHDDGATLIDNPQKVIDRLLALGCTATAYPWPHLPLTTEAEARRLAEGLERSGAALAKAGLTLCYHNHAIEFRKVGEAGRRRTILELIYDETSPAHLQGEIDTYWVQAGGGDPVAWCRRLGGRLPLLHLKDLGVREGNQATTMEVGEGGLDWPAILAAADAGGCRWFIVEQDQCPGDPFDSLASSWRHLSALASVPPGAVARAGITNRHA